MMKRTLTLTIGLLSYSLALVSFMMFGAFLIGIPQQFGIDADARTPLVTSFLINLGLISLFVVQHSIMARPAFKRWWTQYVPEELERTTYVFASAVLLILLVLTWQPLGGVIWDVQDEGVRIALYALYGVGWATVLVSTFFIDHFDLFGLRQVYLEFTGRGYEPLDFRTPGPYKLVRHPLYVGWFTVFWATPTMTISHLLLAATLTAYILFAVEIEEQDLITFHGEDYTDYMQRVGRFFPKLPVEIG